MTACRGCAHGTAVASVFALMAVLSVLAHRCA